MKKSILTVLCGGLIAFNMPAIAASEPSDAEIKAALTAWAKDGAESHEEVMAGAKMKGPKLCNILQYVFVDGYDIKEKNVSSDKAIYKLKPRFVFIKDFKEIVAETKCAGDNISTSLAKDSYGSIEKGKVADGSMFRGMSAATLTLGKFKDGWKMMSYM